MAQVKKNFKIRTKVQSLD